MENQFLEIPDSFWGLFRSKNRQVYIDALLQINEEYQYSNYFLSREICIQTLSDYFAKTRVVMVQDELADELDMLEPLATRILNWLLKSGWLGKVDDYLNMSVNFVIPEYAAVFVSAFAHLAGEDEDDTQVYIQNIYAKAPISFFTDLRDYYIAPTLLTYFKKIVFSNGKECIFYKYNKCPDDAEIEKIVLNLKMSEYHKKKLSKKYTIHEINNEKVELLEKNVNKYTALLKCSHYLEIDTDEILYFGDDLNDVEVFDNLSHCVAMGNAAEQIKKRAAYITKTNKEDGVAFFLTSVLNKYID